MVNIKKNEHDFDLDEAFSVGVRGPKHWWFQLGALGVRSEQLHTLRHKYGSQCI